MIVCANMMKTLPGSCSGQPIIVSQVETVGELAKLDSSMTAAIHIIASEVECCPKQ
jgi:hypothetical protein